METLTSAAAASRPLELRVLDVRPADSFAAGHLKGSGHIAEAELAERRSELPPRDARLLVVAEDGGRARAAAEQIEALGYTRVLWLDGAPASVEALERGPAARLWQPSPFLERLLPLLPPPHEAKRALDLAAGAGREAVFLAMQGYVVEACDHDVGVLEQARALAKRHGVELRTVVRNLEHRDPELPRGEHGLVTVFRFLHRPLLPRIAAAVAPGGALVYETFLRGQERFGRPTHGRFLLDAGELPRHVPGFEIVLYEESTPPEGPWLARLLARKP